MLGPTLEALQKVGDGFHDLADDVLRHLYPRLRPLVPFGINPEGKPIAGTPDSYVGTSPATCSIAVEHTTTKLDRLAGKFLEDYTKAASCSPNIREVILCTNRPRTNEVADSVIEKAKADKMELTIVWGNELANVLDDHRQDLRLKHLLIPFRHLTGHSLVPATQKQLDRALQQFLPKEELARLDSRIHRRPMEARFMQLRRRTGVTMIVADAGLGKTNWSAATARCLAHASPTAWFPAKSIGPGGLNSAIVSAIYGVDDAGRIHELASLLRSTKSVLIVMVDAIDECRNYQQLLKHIGNFLAQSALAAQTHLVLTCRREAVPTFDGIDEGCLPDSGHYEGSRRLKRNRSVPIRRA